MKNFKIAVAMKKVRIYDAHDKRSTHLDSPTWYYVLSDELFKSFLTQSQDFVIPGPVNKTQKAFFQRN